MEKILEKFNISIVAFIIIISLIILIIIFSYVFKVRDRLIYMQEKIKKLKSNARVAKSKYLQVINILKQTNKEISNDTKFEHNRTNIQFSNTPYQYEGLKESKELIVNLANDYQKAQELLNYEINKYNTYVRKLHIILLAKILKFEIISYIDETKLDMIDTHGYNEDDL